MIVRFTVQGANRTEIERRAAQILADFLREPRDTQTEIVCTPLVRSSGGSSVEQWEGDVEAVVS